MAVEVTIPAVGESVATGTISQWHKQNGESVSKGDVLLTLETDKISSEIEAEADGVLTISAEEGEEVDIGAVVATIDPSGTSTAAAAAPSEEAPAEEEKPAAVQASAAAEKLAADAGIDLATITATGKSGGVTKGDVEKAIKEKEEAPAPSVVEEKKAAPKPAAVSKPAPAPDRSADGRVTRKKMSPLRKKIATHLVNAQQTAAILTTFNEVDMSAIMGLRKQVQESFIAKHDVKLGFMSFFVKAVVEALKEVPQINSRMEGDELVEQHYYDIGVAVGTPKGLIVPVLRDCEQKSFAGIEKEIIGYATAARDGKLSFADLQGGCFTISNGGVYGSLLSTPILNPPQSGILGMHTIQQRPVAEDGQVVIRPMMYLALSYDHRIVDGKEAVTFLIRIKECIENPTRLMLEV